MRRAHHLSVDSDREWWARCRFAPLRNPYYAAAFIGALHAIDIELDHAEHRLHGARRAN
jgi:hypothetical protein